MGAVKSAFESVYADLGITCRKVGGIVKADGSYVEGGAPCNGDDDSNDDDDKAMSDDDTKGMSDDDTKGWTDDGTDDDKAAADDGGTDDDKAAADDGGTDDVKAAADGTDDGCNGIGSTTMSTIVVLLYIFSMSAV